MKIQIKNISKSFGNVHANKNIDLEIKSGIHALLGENGAGKSTLVKIISGQFAPDNGQILINETPIRLGSPKESISNGIGLLNQDPLDFFNLSILESFLVGINENAPYRHLKDIRKKISSLLEKYEIKIDRSQRFPAWGGGGRTSALQNGYSMGLSPVSKVRHGMRGIIPIR